MYKWYIHFKITQMVKAQCTNLKPCTKNVMHGGCYNNAFVNEQCCTLWSHEWGGFWVRNLVVTLVLCVCCYWIILLAISYWNQHFSQTCNLVNIWLHWKNEAPNFPEFISLIFEVGIIKVNITISIPQVLKFINSKPPKVWIWCSDC